ncbi:MAG: YggU family protein [Gemmatimonadetes bacterium]|nr:YggU family protein [Gemmatimonadota bacterium]
MLRVEVRGSAVRVSVHVQPRATRSEIIGLHGAALKVRLQAPPVDGAANEALVSLLAERLGVPRRAVRVVSGASSRAKTVEVDGTTEKAVRALAARQ